MPIVIAFDLVMITVGGGEGVSTDGRWRSMEGVALPHIDSSGRDTYIC